MAFIKKGIFVFLVLMGILSGLTLHSREWNRGVEAFSLGMTIAEVESVLLKYHRDFKQSDNYHSQNNYFIAVKDIRDNPFYHNDSNFTISQTSNRGRKYVEGMVVLKKIFGYKLGRLSWMDNSKTFSKGLSSRKVPLSLRMIYRYRQYPVKKLNTLLESAEFGFFDRRLYRISYEINLSSEELIYLITKNNLRETGDGRLVGRADSLYKRGKDQGKVRITLTPSVLEPGRYRVNYTHLGLLDEYNNYLKRVRAGVFNAIARSKYYLASPY